MLPFHKVVEHDFEAVNKLIIKQLHSDVALVENIGHYIIDAGGKRLRPLIVLLSAKALGYEGKQHLDLACIIEFIHTATLLHDDVVDLSHLRRGKATANAKWGNAPSVLVGDFLYSRAFQMLVGIGSMDIMKTLSDATNVISEGEVQQLANVKNPHLSETLYFEVIRKKTAVLFEAACEASAILNNASNTIKENLRAYGEHLGLAFQLADDALDYTGNSDELGKNIGDDLAEGKLTLPLIYAMRQSSNANVAVIKKAIETACADDLDQIVTIIKSTDAIEMTLEKAKTHAQQAKSHIEQLTRSQYTQAMSELADFAYTRTY